MSSNVVKARVEPWATDITSLVTPVDLNGNAAQGPARVPVSAAIPLTGSVAKETAGAAAPDQTLKQFTSSGGLSIASGATVTLYTVTAGKTFYVTDIVVGANTATPFLVQIKQGTQVIWEDYCKGDTGPIQQIGLETQPQGPGSATLTLVLATAASTTATYYIGGYEQ